MRVKKTKFKGLVVLNGIRHQDKRGYLRELVIEKLIKKKFKFQITSLSKKNVLRGLHFQIKKPQGKLISVIKGEIFDVAVDLRRGSPTYRHWVGVTLSAGNHHQLWVPVGFAHGFLTLSDVAEVQYKASGFWNRDCERILRWNDPALAIQWPLQSAGVIEPLLAARDAQAPALSILKFAGDLFG